MHYETTIAIDAPPEKVWSTLIDVDRWPEWTTSVTKIERIDGDALAPAARFRISQPRLRATDWEVTALEPGTSFLWKCKTAGVTTVGSHRIAATAADRVTVTLGVDQSGPMAPIFGRMMAGIARRHVQTEAEGLKRRCET